MCIRDSRKHVRLRRVLIPDGMITEYDPIGAECQSALDAVGTGSNQVYLEHVDVTAGRVVLSDQQLVLIQQSGEGQLWEFIWSIPNENIAALTLSHQHHEMLIALKGDGEDQCTLESRDPNDKSANRFQKLTDSLTARFPQIMIKTKPAPAPNES
eukprot:TRINITY_DN7167_c0_g2_i1.p1 TRINITY_DN7167_c0_g2~~TRINITY_DN7167_c0_g2_i1.p1  ORF type:complete len:155 (-),score=28.17 TRINITY_DN7167_c0_g2_i1:228-692(-)